jgi:hypothetical protein
MRPKKAGRGSGFNEARRTKNEELIFDLEAPTSDLCNATLRPPLRPDQTDQTDQIDEIDEIILCPLHY